MDKLNSHPLSAAVIEFTGTPDKVDESRFRRRNSQKYPAYLKYQLFVSPAFRHLTAAQRDILTLIYFEIEIVPPKKRGKYVEQLANRNEIVMSYREISTRLGYADKAIWSAFKAFLAHGFLKVAKHGGRVKGDYQVYAITEEWRKWEPGKVVRETVKNGRSGWQSKKISSLQGKAVRSLQGKAETPKNEGDFPQGKAVLLKSLDFFPVV